MVTIIKAGNKVRSYDFSGMHDDCYVEGTVVRADDIDVEIAVEARVVDGKKSEFHQGMTVVAPQNGRETLFGIYGKVTAGVVRIDMLQAEIESEQHINAHAFATICSAIQAETIDQAASILNKELSPQLYMVHKGGHHVAVISKHYQNKRVAIITEKVTT